MLLKSGTTPQGRLLKKVGGILLILLNIGCDQVSKEIVRNTVGHKAYIPLLKDYFIITNVENKGAMLGFGQHLSPILKIMFLQGLPIIVLLFLLYRILKKEFSNYGYIVAFSLVIGGGISNLIDRIVYGSVTDFLQIRLSIFKTGIFNMADVSITIGIVLLLILTIKNRKVIM